MKRDRMNEVFELIEARGGELIELARRERWSLEQRWRETYAVDVKRHSGKWILNDFDWHAFSAGLAPHEHGAQAVALYLAELEDAAFVVMPHSAELPAFTYSHSGPIDFSECFMDLLVSPPDLRWTMAFTHEQPDFGPYFSRASWCTPRGA